MGGNTTVRNRKHEAEARRSRRRKLPPTSNQIPRRFLTQQHEGISEVRRRDRQKIHPRQRNRQKTQEESSIKNKPRINTCKKHTPVPRRHTGRPMQQVPVSETKNMLPSKKIKTSSRESLRLMEMLQTSPPPGGPVATPQPTLCK